jgi:hypothetical protein
MKARIFILLGSWFVVLTAGAHPIHVSIVNLDYASDSNRIEMSIRLFYDDFQSLINYKYNTFLDFRQRTRMTQKEQQAISDYIGSSFVLSDQNEKPINTEFKGWKVEDMSVWLYFCAKTKPGLKVLQMKNTLMLDLFVDQKNLVITRIGGNQSGFEFDKRIKTQQINL